MGNDKDTLIKRAVQPHDSFYESPITAYVRHMRDSAEKKLVSKNGLSHFYKPTSYMALDKWVMADKFIRSLIYTERGCKGKKLKRQLSRFFQKAERDLIAITKIRTLFDEIIAFLPKRINNEQDFTEKNLKFLIEEVSKICEHGEAYLHDKLSSEEKDHFITGHHMHDQILLFMWYLHGIIELHDKQILLLSRKQPGNNIYRQGVSAVLHVLLHSNDKYEKGVRTGAYVESYIDFSRLAILIALCAIMSSNNRVLDKCVEEYNKAYNHFLSVHADNYASEEEMHSAQIALMEASMKFRKHIPKNCDRVLKYIDKHLRDHNINIEVYGIFAFLRQNMKYDAAICHKCAVDISYNHRDLERIEDVNKIYKTAQEYKEDDSELGVGFQVSYTDLFRMTSALTRGEKLVRPNKSHKLIWKT